MKVLEILTKARDLISDPARWTQGAFARDRSGDSVHEWSHHAVCWCAMGAVSRVSDTEFGISLDLLCAASGKLASDFNDTHTHAEVLAVFDKAIEAAKAQS